MKSCCGKSSSSSSIPASCIAVAVSTGLAGIVAGCLSFVSFVDVRSFLKHVENKNTDLIKAHFPVWWPNGRDLMLPLVCTTSIVHGISYALTKNKTWLASGGLIFMIGPYTALVLGEDIEALRNSPEDVAKITKRFCNLHHVRLGLALSSLAISLFAMGPKCSKSNKAT